MKFVERTFPYGFRKTPNGNATPRARFEAIAIGSYLALRERPELEDLDPSQIDVDSWIDGEDFTRVTVSDGANAIARLRGRLNFVRDKLVTA